MSRASTDALGLEVDTTDADHVAELVRFASFIVGGPEPRDCWVWMGALGDDGYGRFWLGRPGRDVVRANRYAVAGGAAIGVAVDAAAAGVLGAVALQAELRRQEIIGGWIGADVVAMHDCDNPACVRPAVKHARAGTQAENLAHMSRQNRGRYWVGQEVAARAARSRRLREALADGWDRRRFEAAWDDPDRLTLW